MNASKDVEIIASAECFCRMYEIQELGNLNIQAWCLALDAADNYTCGVFGNHLVVVQHFEFYENGEVSNRAMGRLVGSGYN